MKGIKRRSEGMDSRTFHKQLLESICRDEIKRLIVNFSHDVPAIENPLCVFQEPLFTTKGAYLPDERYWGEEMVSPDIAVVHSHEGWHMLFVEFKSRRFKGNVDYVRSTKIEFSLLYDYILNYPLNVYALFETHNIPGKEENVPREVIESCYITFLGIHRTNRGGIDKTLSCDLPPLPKLLDNPEKYPLDFGYH